MTKINVVVLAGDRKEDRQLEGVGNKALLSIEGRPMVSYVIDGLKASPYIGQISIVGPATDLRAHLGDKVDHYFDQSVSLFDNLRLGLQPFEKDDRVLLVSSDIPLISGEMISDFIEKSQKREGDLCYPIIEKAANEYHFPGIDRTYVRLREGSFTGGNIIYIRPAILDRCEGFARRLIDLRKRPFKISRLLGSSFLISLAMGRLTIGKLEARFSEILDIRAFAIITPFPELCNDVDKASDLYIVNDYLSRSVQ